jgi:phosphatidylserine decarboxylase
MRIDPSGWPFIIGGLIVALVAGLAGGALVGSVLLLLPAFFAFFFRDPERHVDAPPTAVLSPADGRVMVAGASTARGFPPARWQQVSIFLSPLDVHVNRMPVGGTVAAVAYHPGRFLPAYRREAGDLNEHTEVTVEHDGHRVVARQVVGALARRIVCRAKAGDVVRAGDRFGLMKFGSRMDVFVPADATLSTRVGDRVIGGVTILATLAPVPAATRPGAADRAVAVEAG